MVKRSTKFTGICIAIYLVYAIFAFIVLPMMLPDPVTMIRNTLIEETRHLGNLSNMTIEAGGIPARSILATFRGSGAIELLNQLTHQPGCYHHFSPLIAYRQRIKDKLTAARALEELNALLHCDYNRSMTMLSVGMRVSTFRKFYGVQSKICSAYPREVCENPEILSQICKIFPFLNMSVYNLSLKFLMALLELNDLNVRILLLVRDPRATIASRSNGDWCNASDCVNPMELCASMEDDYEIAEVLLKKYPKRFGIVRYEELAKNPFWGISLVFDFYGVPMNSVKLAASTNKTNIIKENVVFEPTNRWQKLLLAKDITEIQVVCKKAMKLWGYYPIRDFEKEIHEDTFKPLRKLRLFSN